MQDFRFCYIGPELLIRFGFLFEYSFDQGASKALRIQTSPLIADISGKVKDVVFSSWKGRPYVRTRNVPIGAPSVDQLRIRDYYSKATFCWQQFTQEYKDSWRLSADGKVKSGFNLWLNTVMQLATIFNFNQSTPFNPTVGIIEGFYAQQGVLPRSVDMVWSGGPFGPEYMLSIYFRYTGGHELLLVSHDDIFVSDLSGTVFGTASARNCYIYVAVQNVVSRQLSLSVYSTQKTG